MGFTRDLDSCATKLQIRYTPKNDVPARYLIGESGDQAGEMGDRFMIFIQRDNAIEPYGDLIVTHWYNVQAVHDN